MTNQDLSTETEQEIAVRIRQKGQIEYIAGKFGQYTGLVTGIKSIVEDDYVGALIRIPIYAGVAYLSEIDIRKSDEWEMVGEEGE